MAVKTIFAPILALEGEIDDFVSDFAFDTATRHHAQLAVLLGIPEQHFTYPEGGLIAKTVVEGINAGLLETGQETAETLRALGQSRGVPTVVEVIEAPIGSLHTAMLRRARMADVVMMKAADTGRDADRRLAEELLMGAGRPTLLVPEGWKRQAYTDRVVLAWDGSAKATRAIHDALPLIDAFDAVEILVVNETGEAGDDDRLFFDHVRQHIPQAKLVPVAFHNERVASVIAAYARMRHARLLVAGAYGHSHLKEALFGGVTLHLFDGPPCPLMLSY
jgi:nucleotide-binding universal stress UspA family protein